MASSDRELLERAVASIAEQVAAADRVVEERTRPDSHPLTIEAKMLRQELPNTKAAFERELGLLVLDCTACGQTVHHVAGLGVSPGRWAHREPAPHHEPVV